MQSKKALELSTETTVVVMPATAEITVQSLSLSSRAASVEIIRTQSDADRAAEVRAAGKAMLKQIDDLFDEAIKNAHVLHKGLLSKKKEAAEPIEKVITGLNRQLGLFEDAKEKRRLAEQRRLQEQARIDAETQALAEAASLEAMGQRSAAEMVLNEALESPAIQHVVLAKEKTAGIASRQVWKWELVDIGKIPSMFLVITREPSTGLNQTISTGAIGALVRALKDKEVAEQQLNCGVRVWSETIII
jgi:hypothetical protein